MPMMDADIWRKEEGGGRREEGGGMREGAVTNGIAILFNCSIKVCREGLFVGFRGGW